MSKRPMDQSCSSTNTSDWSPVVHFKLSVMTSNLLDRSRRTSGSSSSGSSSSNDPRSAQWHVRDGLGGEDAREGAVDTALGAQTTWHGSCSWGH